MTADDIAKLALTLGPELFRVIKTAIEGDDSEAEKEAAMHLQKAIARERARRKFEGT